MDHRRFERDGSVFLVVSDGERGAVSLEAWTGPEGDAHGVLVLHYPRPLTTRQESARCEFLPGGRCHPDSSFTAGHELAPDVLAGYDARALVELYRWFGDRMMTGWFDDRMTTGEEHS